MKEKLKGRFRKEDMVQLINHETGCFEETLCLARADYAVISWRAAWVLYHAIAENDIRLQGHLDALVESIPGKGDGHQRELLRILGKMDIPAELEGKLFDVCMTLWEQVGKIPSVRIFAFRILHKIAGKYPELQAELRFLSQQQYTETLSPGIRNSLMRLMGNDVSS